VRQYFSRSTSGSDSPNTASTPGPLMTLFSLMFAALWLSSIAAFNSRSIRVIGAGLEYRRIVSASF
jgi:hypothetical protein